MPPIAIFNLLAIGLVLFASAVQMLYRPRDRNMQGLFFSCLLQFLVLFVDNAALTVVTHATSIRYDEYVFCFDRFFGSPSFVIGRLFLEYPWFRDISLSAYVLIPAACLGVVAAYFFWLPWNDAVCSVRTIFLSCLLAYPIYVIFPVAGPRYAFPNFPAAIPANFAPHLLYQSSLPNGVPSVHMALALLVFWFCRPWVVGKIFGGIFLVLIVASTLGSGEHYLFDLIVAIPYTGLVIYLGGYSPQKEKLLLETPQDAGLAVSSVSARS